MSNNNNQLLNFPFDEPTGSTIVYDYSPSGTTATLAGTAAIVKSGCNRGGNCLQIGGTGSLNNSAYSFNAASDYTIAVWVRRDSTPTDQSYFHGEQLTVFFHAASGSASSTERSYAMTEGVWQQYIITKQGLNITISRDGATLDTFTITEQPDYLLLLQDGAITGLSYASIDDLVVYNEVLTPSEVNEAQAARLRYYIDYIDIRERWGIRFEKSNGLLARPKTKSPTKVDWADYHGEVVDLTSKRVEARTITLKGWMPANGKGDFITKWNEFVSIFDKDGTQRLMLECHPTKPLVYEVYLEDEMDADKKWDDGLMVGTFTLKLKEPDPVKRVVRIITTSTNQSLRIKMTSPKAVSIYWGDGSVDDDLNGTIDKSHTYASAGTYYAIVGGVIEEITNFSTNGIVVWEKI